MYSSFFGTARLRFSRLSCNRFMTAMLRNIIFDLGGLFIDVYMERTQQQLEALTGCKLSNELSQLKAENVFDAYEKGEIDSEVFLHKIRETLPIQLSTSQITMAWNAVLGDFHRERLEGIQPLRKHYRVFLLSNTNELHVAGFEDILEKKYGFRSLEPYFDKVYFSQRMGLRKPEPAIFHQLLIENNLKASETLFIDDSPVNLMGAKTMGLQIAHHAPNADIVLTLQEFGLFDH